MVGMIMVTDMEMAMDMEIMVAMVMEAMAMTPTMVMVVDGEDMIKVTTATMVEVMVSFIIFKLYSLF